MNLPAKKNLLKRLIRHHNCSKFLNLIFIKIRFLFWRFRPSEHIENKNEIFFANYLISDLKKISDKPSFNLLEIGCGSGKIIKTLGKSFPLSDFVGYDINIRNIKLEQKKNQLKNLKLYIKNINKVENFNFDIIISKASLIYLDNFQLDNFLSKLINSKFKKSYFFELCSNQIIREYRTHFYAHNYDFKLLKFFNEGKINYKIHKKLNLPEKWFAEHEVVFPAIIEITKKVY